MVRALIAFTSGAALVALFGTPMPSVAQEMERKCNPVVDSAGDPVVEPSGGVVAHLGTYPCPPEPVAQVEPAAPPPAPAPLPEEGVVYFDFDKANIRPDAENTIDSIVADIRNRNLSGITVAGYADRAGPPDYNMKLSEQRAQSVASELVKQGIPTRVIQTEAFGETDPAVETPDGVPLEANRRVTIGFKA